MSIGENLRLLRHSKKLTSEQLADIFSKKHNLNMHKAMISKWENNKVIPSTSSLLMYCEYFSISMDWILNLSPTKKLIDRESVYKEKYQNLKLFFRDNDITREEVIRLLGISFYGLAQRLNSKRWDFRLDEVRKLMKTYNLNFEDYFLDIEGDDVDEHNNN